MNQFILRLDDASDYMDVNKWQHMEELLDRYNISPLVGIIPDNQDSTLIGVYEQDFKFWDKTSRWQEKGWELALHGCYHKYTTDNGGINPVNRRSEFAGVSLSEQKKMIQHGISILKNHEINPRIFFAPSHTFDKNTLIALKQESDIRIISDTIANDIYFENGFFFIPQQSGQVRKLPLHIVTFCYHPNMMEDIDFDNLEQFIKSNVQKYVGISDLIMKKRRKSLFDMVLQEIYFAKRR